MASNYCPFNFVISNIIIIYRPYQISDSARK